MTETRDEQTDVRFGVVLKSDPTLMCFLSPLVFFLPDQKATKPAYELIRAAVLLVAWRSGVVFVLWGFVFCFGQ